MSIEETDLFIPHPPYYIISSDSAGYYLPTLKALWLQLLNLLTLLYDFINYNDNNTNNNNTTLCRVS